jgi:hypothetical protein
MLPDPAAQTKDFIAIEVERGLPGRSSRNYTARSEILPGS